MRQIILTIIAFALLWSFQSSTGFYQDNSADNSAIFDAAQDEEPSEMEDNELEKFVNHEFKNLPISKLSSQVVKRDDPSLPKNFLVVPTSPPNC
jgi:nitrogen fixation-related uncharacterized protein